MNSKKTPISVPSRADIRNEVFREVLAIFQHRDNEIAALKENLKSKTVRGYELLTVKNRIINLRDAGKRS